MKIGIMQPYFLPYIGYWQLMNAVDKYIIYDDVNYINRGWINRNRILINGTPKYLSISVANASQNKKINEIQIVHESKSTLKRMRMIECAYRKAPYYNRIIPLVERILTCEASMLAEFIENSFYVICEYLDIKTEFILSSSLNKDSGLKGQEKILNICELLGATEYYNAIGGKQLYSSRAFQNKGINLKFVRSKDIMYKQFSNEFRPGLSIIDVMMFNSREEVKAFLYQCSIEY